MGEHSNVRLLYICFIFSHPCRQDVYRFSQDNYLFSYKNKHKLLFISKDILFTVMYVISEQKIVKLTKH